MAILPWIFLGVAWGYLASKLVVGRGVGTARDMLVGLLGAVVGGLVFHVAGGADATRFTIWTLYVATAGALVTLTVYHAAMHDRLRQ